MIKMLMYEWQIGKARRLAKKLAQLPNHIAERAIEENFYGFIVRTRFDGHKISMATIEHHFDQRMKEVGLVASKCNYERERSRVTDCNFLTFSVHISNADMLSRMYLTLVKDRHPAKDGK